MRALLASVLAIAVSFGRADGQSGTIVYAAGASLDVDVPREMAEALEVLEAMSRVSYLLHFTPTESLMVWDGAREDGAFSPAGFLATKTTLDAFALTLDAWLAAEPSILAKAYVEVEQSSGIKVLRSLSVDMYRVTAAVPPVEWRVTEQQGEHLGYRVTRAVGEVGRDSVEAWFAPDIPVSVGPALYGGLPGMILVLSLDQGRTVYAATEVALETVEDGLIQVPKEGESVSSEEFRSIINFQIEDIISLFRDMVRYHQDVKCIVGRRDSFIQCRRVRGGSSR